MKSTTVAAVTITTATLLLSLSFVDATKLVVDGTRATHIIKLRSAMNTSTAHDFILVNHRAYTLSQNEPRTHLRRSTTTDILEGYYDKILSEAATAEFGQPMFLDSLTVDDNFTAVSGIFPDDRFIDYLHQQHNVEYVETNQVYKAQMLLPLQDYNILSNSDHPTYLERMNSEALTDEEMKKNKKRGSTHTAIAPNWGQARVTQRQKGGDLNRYSYDDTAGEGVHVFVLDTGVNTNHMDFEGRAVTDANFVATENETDLGGHGTHVAGKIAGRLYGIAKKVHIHSVKILDQYGDGTTANLIRGILHVMKVAPSGKSLINLSLSGPKSRLIDEILSKAATQHNIPIFVSSGNSATDACFFSPSSNPNVFSVGASDLNDDVPTYSDVGECVRLYAPGSDIESTWIGNTDAIQLLDGTSMANPHVTGIAATLLSRRSYSNVEELYSDLVRIGTPDTLSFKWSKMSSPNHNTLAFVENAV